MVTWSSSVGLDGSDHGGGRRTLWSLIRVAHRRSRGFASKCNRPIVSAMDPKCVCKEVLTALGKLAIVVGLLWTAGGSSMAWSASFVLASAKERVVGVEQVVTALPEDTLLDIARRHGLGYEEIRLANPELDTWIPGAGEKVVLPTRFVLPNAPRRGIVINLAELRLYYYLPGSDSQPPRVMTFPVSIGRSAWPTPQLITSVIAKDLDPAWRPPASIRAERAQRGETLPARVPPGPDNPLGRHSLRLERPSYLIHGTNKPYSIGMQVTHGCIRLYPEDIATLHQSVPLGTPVQIVNQQVKAAWHRGTLYVEVHQKDEGQPAFDTTAVVREIVAATPSGQMQFVDWEQVNASGQLSRGAAVPVSFATTANQDESKTARSTPGN